MNSSFSSKIVERKIYLFIAPRWITLTFCNIMTWKVNFLSKRWMALSLDTASRRFPRWSSPLDWVQMRGRFQHPQRKIWSFLYCSLVYRRGRLFVSPLRYNCVFFNQKRKLPCYRKFKHRRECNINDINKRPNSSSKDIF